jgi:hypothetical protein
MGRLRPSTSMLDGKDGNTGDLHGHSPGVSNTDRFLQLLAASLGSDIYTSSGGLELCSVCRLCTVQGQLGTHTTTCMASHDIFVFELLQCT